MEVAHLRDIACSVVLEPSKHLDGRRMASMEQMLRASAVELF